MIFSLLACKEDCFARVHFLGGASLHVCETALRRVAACCRLWVETHGCREGCQGSSALEASQRRS